MTAVSSAPALPQRKVDSAPLASELSARTLADPMMGVRGDEPARESAQRVWPLFVTVFALAVLGGVGYLVWVVLVGMGSGARP
jgi:hypothetical protein